MSLRDTEMVAAKRQFLRETAALPGVIRIATSGGANFLEQSFHIHIAANDTPTEKEVYRVKGDILRAFPNVHFATYVNEGEVFDVES